MEPQNLYYQEINLNPKIIANRNQYYLIVMKRLDKQHHFLLLNYVTIYCLQNIDCKLYLEYWSLLSFFFAKIFYYFHQNFQKFIFQINISFKDLLSKAFCSFLELSNLLRNQFQIPPFKINQCFRNYCFTKIFCFEFEKIKKMFLRVILLKEDQSIFLITLSN